MQNGINKTNSDASCSNKASEDINAVFSFENLYRSFEKCTKGVKWKMSTQNYMVNACCRIARLRKSIIEGTYKGGKMRFFKICERGKIRDISALTFQDRIVHKCLCDYYLTPLLSKSLIYDSGATIKGKGLAFTRKRVVCHLQKYYRKHGNKGFVLKIDIHHYFESIDQEVLFELLKRKIKNEELYKFTISLIPQEIKGLGLGSQVSQICAMFYLNELDHFIKEKLRFKYYGRYMDDLYILCFSRNKVEEALIKIREKLRKIKLTLNETKTKIYELSQGFVFCKTRYYLKEGGKVVRLPTGHSFRVFNRKIKIGIDSQDIVPAFKSYVLQFNCYKRLCKQNLQYIIYS